MIDGSLTGVLVKLSTMCSTIHATELTLADGRLPLPFQAGTYEIDLCDFRPLKPV